MTPPLAAWRHRGLRPSSPAGRVLLPARGPRAAASSSCAGVGRAMHGTGQAQGACTLSPRTGTSVRRPVAPKSLEVTCFLSLATDLRYRHGNPQGLVWFPGRALVCCRPVCRAAQTRTAGGGREPCKGREGWSHFPLDLRHGEGGPAGLTTKQVDGGWTGGRLDPGWSMLGRRPGAHTPPGGPGPAASGPVSCPASACTRFPPPRASTGPGRLALHPPHVALCRGLCRRPFPLPSPALVARLSALRPVIASTGKSTPLPTPCRSLWHPERCPAPRRTTPPPTPAEAGRRLGVVSTVGFPAPAQSPAQSSSLRGISRFPG